MPASESPLHSEGGGEKGIYRPDSGESAGIMASDGGVVASEGARSGRLPPMEGDPERAWAMREIE